MYLLIQHHLDHSPFYSFFSLRSRWLEETQELKSYITLSQDSLSQDSLIPNHTHSVGCFHSDGGYWQRNTQNYSWHLIGLIKEDLKQFFFVVALRFVFFQRYRQLGLITKHVFLSLLMNNSLLCICRFPQQLLQSNPKHHQEVKWGAECPPASMQPLCSPPCSAFLW